MYNLLTTENQTIMAKHIKHYSSSGIQIVFLYVQRVLNPCKFKTVFREICTFFVLQQKK